MLDLVLLRDVESCFDRKSNSFALGENPDRASRKRKTGKTTIEWH